MTSSVSILTLVAVLTLALFLALFNLALWRAQREDQVPLWLAAWLTASAVFALCRLLQYATLNEPMYLALFIYLSVFGKTIRKRTICVGS